MKIRPVLADTGRPAGAAANLLNAGWTFTTAIQLPQGGWTVPGQALALFIEAPWDQLNRPHALVIELVDDEGKPAHFAPGPDRGGQRARIQHQVSVPPVPNAPNGTPGLTSLLMDMPAGTLWIAAPRRRYIWKITAGDVREEAGFWVEGPLQLPVLGGVGPVLPPAQPA